MMLQGLALAASDLIGALLVLGAVSLAVWAIAREERKYEEERFSETVERVDSEAEEEWSWPPRSLGSPAESRFGKTRIGVDREAA